jgi:hypothetical protein
MTTGISTPSIPSQRTAQAAKVYREISTQVENFSAAYRTKHLTEIHAAPTETWALLAGLLQELNCRIQAGDFKREPWFVFATKPLLN